MYRPTWITQILFRRRIKLLLRYKLPGRCLVKVILYEVLRYAKWEMKSNVLVTFQMPQKIIRTKHRMEQTHNGCAPDTSLRFGYQSTLSHCLDVPCMHNRYNSSLQTATVKGVYTDWRIDATLVFGFLQAVVTIRLCQNTRRSSVARL